MACCWLEAGAGRYGRVCFFQAKMRDWVWGVWVIGFKFFLFFLFLFIFKARLLVFIQSLALTKGEDDENEIIFEKVY